MTNNPPLIIENLNIFCIYSLEVSKKDKISVNESESGDEILYLIRKNAYSLSVSFKCNAQTGTKIDEVVTGGTLLHVKFMDMGVQKSVIMRVADYSYSCITMCGAEIWDMKLALTESVRTA